MASTSSKKIAPPRPAIRPTATSVVPMRPAGNYRTFMGWAQCEGQAGLADVRHRGTPHDVQMRKMRLDGLEALSCAAIILLIRAWRMLSLQWYVTPNSLAVFATMGVISG